MKEAWTNKESTILEDDNVILQDLSTKHASFEQTNGYYFYDQASEFYQKGEMSKAEELLFLASNKFSAEDQIDGIIDCLLLEGKLCRNSGKFDLAQAKFSQVLVLARNSHNIIAEIDSLNLQASIYSICGNDELAHDYLEQALEIAEQVNNDRKRADILTNIGWLNFKLGNYAKALEDSNSARLLFKSIAPESRNAAANLLHIGNIYRDINELENAMEFYEKAKKLGIKIQDFAIKSVALSNLGFLFLRSDKFEDALSFFQQALEINELHSQKQYMIDNLDGIGQVHVAKGNFPKAIEVHSQALKVAQDLGEIEGEAESLLSLGKDYLALNDIEKAIEHFNLAIKIAKELEYRKTIYELHKLLSEAYELLKDIPNAYFHHKEYHRVEKEVFNEKSEETTRQLTVKFDLERARFEAQEYRLSSEVAERATQEAEKIVQIRTRELEGAQLEVVMRLAQAAELRDEDTGEHTFRVGRNAAAIAYCLGWSEAEVKIIYLAARLHDVGKIGISDTILLKPGKLTDDEFELMRQHTVIGAKMLSNGQSTLLRMAEKIALSHHERWDGNGYPNKLAGEAIPDVARIVSVADVLDALTHARPYKKAWSVEATLAEIERNSGRQFDPNIVRIAIKVFSGEKCLSPVAKPSDWEETFKELQDLFGLSRFSM